MQRFPGTFNRMHRISGILLKDRIIADCLDTGDGIDNILAFAHKLKCIIVWLIVLFFQCCVVCWNTLDFRLFNTELLSSLLAYLIQNYKNCHISGRFGMP